MRDSNPRAGTRGQGSGSPDILLAICPPWSVIVPPIGLNYLGASLEAAGMRAEILDVNLAVYRAVGSADRDLWRFMHEGFACVETYEALLTRHPGLMQGLVDRILESGSPVVGCSIASYNKLFSLDLLRRLKARRPSLQTVIGGFGVTLHHEIESPCRVHLDGGITRGGRTDEGYLHELLRAVDLAVIGEAEESLVELLRELRCEGEPGTGPPPSRRTIPGVIRELFEPLPEDWRPAEQIMDLDRLPVPEYRDLGETIYESSALPVLGSRGCVGNCAFCTDRKIWQRYRHRSAGSVAEEIDRLHRLHGTTHFKFNDQVLNGDRAELARLADLLSRKPYVGRLTWGGNAIVRKGMDLEYLRRLRAGGCRWLIFGVEAGSNRVLKAMRKGFRRDLALQTIKDAHQAGLYVHINIITGFPGEGEEEFLETLSLLRELAPCLHSVANLGPLMVSPATDLERHAGRFGIELPPWDHHSLWYEMGRINHPAERHTRLRRCLALLESLEVKIGGVNSLMALDGLEKLPVLPMSPDELKSVGRSAKPEVVRFYRELVECPDLWLRQHALWALGRLEDLGGVRLIEEALDDPHPWVRRNALDSLGRITGPVGRLVAF